MNNPEDLKRFLEAKCRQYDEKAFISTDPVSIPHLFRQKEDREIAGFLTAIISWGNRKAILKSGKRMMELMENEPYDFVVSAPEHNFGRLADFVYRTFNGDDLLFLMYALRKVYLEMGGLEKVAAEAYRHYGTVKAVIMALRKSLLLTEHLARSEKHLANPEKGSAAKRINMFLRWMVRKDKNGVDFGIWDEIPVSALMCPLDVHSGYVARKLGLLARKQNDWKAVEELTENLRKFDSEDPVKYDYALFGLGVFEGFGK